MEVVVNTVLSLLAALGLGYVVLHPRIYEGTMIKAGLIVMIISLLGSAAAPLGDNPLSTATNAGLSLRLGIVIVGLGYFLKYRRHRKDGTPTDFGSLTER